MKVFLMNKLLLMAFSLCTLQTVFAMDQSLTLSHAYNSKDRVGNSLIRPDGKKLDDLSLRESQYPMVLNVADYKLLERMILNSNFTGKFLLYQEPGLTSQVWHDNFMLPKNVLDNCLLVSAKNGRCKIGKQTKDDIHIFSSALKGKEHNWSYFELGPILINDEELVERDAFEIKDEAKRALLWSILKTEIEEAQTLDNLNQIQCDESEESRDMERILGSSDMKDLLKQLYGNIDPVIASEQPAPEESKIGWLKNKACAVYGWCTENPKEAFGLIIGTGVLSWLAYKYYTGEKISLVQQVIEPVQQVIEPIQQVVQPVGQVIKTVSKHAPPVIQSVQDMKFVYDKILEETSNVLGPLRKK